MIRSCCAVWAVSVAWAGAQAAAGTPPKGPPFAFGGAAPYGPYRVTIAVGGAVRVSGNGGLSRLGVTRLGPAQIAALNRVAAGARFGSLAASTRCPTAHPGAATWVKIGGRTVTVDGTCLPAFQRVLRALVAAVRFYSSG